MPSFWPERKHQVNTAAFYLELNRLDHQDSQRPSGQPRKQIAISIGPDESKPVDWLSRAAVYAAFLPAKQLNAPSSSCAGHPCLARHVSKGPDDRRWLFGFQGHRKNHSKRDYRLRTKGDQRRAGPLHERTCKPLAQPAKGRRSAAVADHADRAQCRLDRAQRSFTPANPAGSARRRNCSAAGPDIVYMAPACTIRDFTESVIPFMELKNHSDSQFFDLSMLHPSAETLEAEFYELIPRGSLLCWIDDFLGSPQTPLDRTLGAADNILQVPYVFPQSLRGRVAIKAFALECPGARLLPAHLGAADPR